MQKPAMFAFSKRDGKFPVLVHRRRRRHGVAILEPHGLHAEGRPDIPTPPQKFRWEFLEKNYLNK